MKTTESFLPVFPGTYGTIFEDIDWDQTDEIGRKLVSVVNEYISELGITAEYQEFISPKFYNFSNDSVNVVYSYENLDALKAWIHDNIKAVQQELKEKYTSRDGFISHHSTDVQDWIDNLKTDKHKLGAMLGMYIHFQYDREQCEMEMYERLGQNGLLIYEDEEE